MNYDLKVKRNSTNFSNDVILFEKAILISVTNDKGHLHWKVPMTNTDQKRHTTRFSKKKHVFC